MINIVLDPDTETRLTTSLTSPFAATNLISSIQSAINSSVTSFNSLSGAVNLVAGGGITLIPSGQNITVAATGGGGSIVAAHLALINQGADIVEAALFTPSATGLYQISLYGVCTVADAGAGRLSPTVSYTDDGGIETNVPIGTLVGGGVAWNNQFIELTATPLAGVAGPGSFCFSAQLVSGQPVTFSVTGGGTYGLAQYSLYVSAIKLF